MSHSPLIERESERAWLESALSEAREGRGSLVLLTGEAGTGKTRFAEEVVAAADVQFLRGAAGPGAVAYEPVVAALRSFLRAVPGGLARCGPLRPHLALLLPELGATSGETDRTTLVEAIRCGLVTVARHRPAAMLLDDLQWSDAAMLELLASLAGSLRELPMLVIASYRCDEIPRAHQLRRLRDDLRRHRLLRELTLEPLSAQGTADLARTVLATRSRLVSPPPCTTAPAASPSSSRSSPARFRPRDGFNRATTASSSWRSTRRYRSPRRSATRCSSARATSPSRPGRPRRPSRSPAPSSTSTSSPASAGTPGWTSSSRAA